MKLMSCIISGCSSDTFSPEVIEAEIRLSGYSPVPLFTDLRVSLKTSLQYPRNTGSWLESISNQLSDKRLNFGIFHAKFLVVTHFVSDTVASTRASTSSGLLWAEEYMGCKEGYDGRIVFVGA